MFVILAWPLSEKLQISCKQGLNLNQYTLVYMYRNRNHNHNNTIKPVNNIKIYQKFFNLLTFSRMTRANNERKSSMEDWNSNRRTL